VPCNTLLAGRGLTAPNSNSSTCCQSGTLYLRQTTHPHTHVGTSVSTSAPLTGTWVCQTDKWSDEMKSRVRNQCVRTVRSTVLLPTSACQGFSSHTRKTAVSYSPQAQSTNPHLTTCMPLHGTRHEETPREAEQSARKAERICLQGCGHRRSPEH
jgi:hypothetical protein